IPGGGPAPGAWSCPLVGSDYNCSASPIAGLGSSTLTISATDTANSTTPAATTASDPNSQANGTMTVNSALALSLPSQVSIQDAVTGRRYGTGGGCTGGACTPITFSVTGGLTTYGAGNLVAGGDNFVCTGARTYSCSISAITGSGTPTLAFTATENGNNSTPSGTVTDSTSRTLTIQPPLALTSVIASPWPDAVNGRSYGLNGTTLQFNATNGLPPYVSYNPAGLSADFTCSVLNASAGSCSSAGITAAQGTYNNVTVTVADTGNASTPASTPSSPDAGSVSTNS